MSSLFSHSKCALKHKRPKLKRVPHGMHVNDKTKWKRKKGRPICRVNNKRSHKLNKRQTKKKKMRRNLFRIETFKCINISTKGILFMETDWTVHSDNLRAIFRVSTFCITHAHFRGMAKKTSCFSPLSLLFLFFCLQFFMLTQSTYHYCRHCYHRQVVHSNRCLRRADANDCADSNDDGLARDCDANGVNDCCYCLQPMRWDRADFLVTVIGHHFQHALGLDEVQHQHWPLRHRPRCRWSWNAIEMVARPLIHAASELS